MLLLTHIGIESRLNKREMGHIHDDRVADLQFIMDVGNNISAHHFLPQSGRAIQDEIRFSSRKQIW